MTPCRIPRSAKRGVRFIYASLIFFVAKIINPKVSLKGLGAVQRELKSSEDLLLVAPGSSLASLTQDDWIHFQDHDRLFVNYAARHKSFQSGDILSTEPHPTIAEFADTVANLDGPVLLKGFTSLSNVHVCLKTIWHLRRAREKVVMIREIDASDLRNFPVVEDYYSNYFGDDRLYNIALLDGASLIYFLNFGIRLGYRSITLIGFDFDDHYFFDDFETAGNGVSLRETAPSKHILSWDDFFIRKVERICRQADLVGCDVQSFKCRIDIRNLGRAEL